MHTSTPYKIAEGNEALIEPVSDSRDENFLKVAIADCSFCNPFVVKVPKDEQKANAEFIVRACNSHEQLVLACERLLKIARTVTVRQAISAGQEVIDATGLNPWCLNEGLATGDEHLCLHFAEDAIRNATVSIRGNE
jgi:hypothetical protein